MIDKIFIKYSYDSKEYSEVAVWCNENNATIEDMGEYYKVVRKTIDKIKENKLNEIDSWTEKKIIGGFTSTCTGEKILYDSDKETQLTMQGIALAMNNGAFMKNFPTGCQVRGYPEGGNAKQIYLLTPEQIILWLADLYIHIQTCKELGWEKQIAVNNAKTIDDINNIVLE